MEIPAGMPRTAWLGRLKLFGLIRVKPVSYISAIGVWWFLPKFKTESRFIQKEMTK